MRHSAILSILSLIAVLFLSPVWASDAPVPSPAPAASPAAPAPTAPIAPAADVNRRKEDEIEVIKPKVEADTIKITPNGLELSGKASVHGVQTDMRDGVSVQRPTIGRIVLFQLKTKDGRVVTRPAIVVHVWSRTDGQMPLVQLQVFTDSGNDGVGGPDGIKWATSVHYDEAQTEGTWCWMPYQMGQAAKTEQTRAAYADRIQRLEDLMATMAQNFTSAPATKREPVEKDGLRVH